MSRNMIMGLGVAALIVAIIAALLFRGPQTQPADTVATPNAQSEADLHE